uniref:Uncharacterized protein n=1 Tax=Anguilla anguilla TaxID=7936 RepID=A0A0E9PNL9_ANGAN
MANAENFLSRGRRPRR